LGLGYEKNKESGPRLPCGETCNVDGLLILRTTHRHELKATLHKVLVTTANLLQLLLRVPTAFASFDFDLRIDNFSSARRKYGFQTKHLNAVRETSTPKQRATRHSRNKEATNKTIVKDEHHRQ